MNPVPEFLGNSILEDTNFRNASKNACDFLVTEACLTRVLLMWHLVQCGAKWDSRMTSVLKLIFVLFTYLCGHSYKVAGIGYHRGGDALSSCPKDRGVTVDRTPNMKHQKLALQSGTLPTRQKLANISCSCPVRLAHLFLDGIAWSCSVKV